MLEDHHFHVEWFSGTGKGGQHRNKHENCCRLYHLPTGLVETRQGRVRTKNYEEAKMALLKQLEEKKNEERYNIMSQTRSDLVGTGMRGDKVRTIRFQDDTVTDHRTGKKMSAKKFMKGFMNELWS